MTYGDCCFDYEIYCKPEVFDDKDILGLHTTLQSDNYKNVVFNRQPVSGGADCVESKPGVAEFGILLIDTCSENVDVATTEACVGHTDRYDPESFIPVYGPDGRHYKNRFCALCNGIDPSTLKAWTLKFDCYDDFNPLADDTSDKTTVDIMLELLDQCTIDLVSPTFDHRYCFPTITYQCDDEFSDLEIVRACQSYSAPVQIGNAMYKNPHCAACNNVDMSSSFQCILSNPLTVPAAFGFPTVILFDFSPNGNSRIYDLDGEFDDITAHHEATCGVGATFDPYLARCRQIYCGDNFKLMNGSCLLDPKFGSGFDFNFTNSFWRAEIETLSDEELYYDSLQVFLDSLQDSVGECEIQSYLSTEIGQNFSDSRCVIEQDFVNALVIFGYGQNPAEVVDLFERFIFNVSDDCPESTSIGVLTSIIVTNYENMSKVIQSCDKDGWYLATFNSTQYTTTTKDESRVIHVATEDVYGSFDSDFTFQKLSTSLDNVDEIKTWSSVNHVYLCIPEIKCVMIILRPYEFTWIGDDNNTLLHIKSERQIASEHVFISPSSAEVRVCSSSLKASAEYPYPALFITNDNQTLVSVIGCTVSIIALFMVVITYVTFPKLRNIPGKTVMNLSFALLVAQLLLQTAVDKTSNYVACFIIAGSMHYFWLAVFFWTNVLAYDLGRTFGWQSGMRSEPSRFSFVKYALYGWGSPVIIIGFSVAIHFMLFIEGRMQNVYELSQMCWITAGYQLLVAFGAPVALLLMVNVVFFGYTVIGIVRTRSAAKILKKETNKFVQLQDDLYLYIRLSLVVGLTWIIGFIIPYTGIQDLWYVFIILNSLQGPIIFISFTWNNKTRLLWRRKIRGILGLPVDDVKTSNSTASSALSVTKKAASSVKHESHGLNRKDLNENRSDLKEDEVKVNIII
ncbi:uncharacterized protein [Amphiura filiformis]|uniref:uncharacterized protein n=1 Tax=Amphiura filiformis TaxID=82378 RepID=UPI003B21ED64